MMMQRTAKENAACKRRIYKRSDQPKVDRIAINDARLLLRKKLGTCHGGVSFKREEFIFSYPGFHIRIDLFLFYYIFSITTAVPIIACFLVIPHVTIFIS